VSEAGRADDHGQSARPFSGFALRLIFRFFASAIEPSPKGTGWLGAAHSEDKLLKHYQPARPNVGNKTAENRGRLSDVHQNETSNNGVEGRARPEAGRSLTSSNETFGNPASAALFHAQLIPATDRSIPRTHPADPTSPAIRNETSSTPHPQSSTAHARLDSRSLHDVFSDIANKAQLADQPHSSHSASPRTYSWAGAAGAS
jgi:hypothetical protein